MMDLETAKKNCEISDYEESVLLGAEKPIVLLKQKDTSNISQCINPNINTLGVMLPYTGFHIQLIKEVGSLVVTSAYFW
jgi:hydrogenase maturation protein HypF